jgi:hypothetical protein
MSFSVYVCACVCMQPAGSEINACIQNIAWHATTVDLRLLILLMLMPVTTSQSVGQSVGQPVCLPSCLKALNVSASLSTLHCPCYIQICLLTHLYLFIASFSA